jgi:NADPH:quinone reductase-like Zn-dependent oxidoreductase
MKASVFTEYGPPEVLRVQEVAAPGLKDGDVLIRVRATTVNFGDTLVRNLKAVSPRKFHMPFLFWLIGRGSFGFTRPRRTILGSEFAGEVVGVGADVTRFRVGDEVFGYCGPRMGAYAEYLCMPEDGVIAPKPANLTYEEAAAIPYGAVIAMGLLRRVRLQAGQRVLVNGASGGIGPAVLQLAVAQFGARVTGVCGTSRVDYVRSLGADDVIDYTKQDYVDSGEMYDVIIDILGKSSFARCRRVLAPDGRLVFVSFKMRQVLQMLWTSVVGSRKVICVLVNEKPEDLVFIKGLIEAGKLRSVVDRTFPLEQAAEAHRFAQSGARKGNVVITVL